MKYFWYFLKQMIFPLVYMVILSITSISITAINNNLLWLKYLLNVIVLAFFGVILGGVAWKDGQDAAKVLHANDIERQRIIETGEDRPLNLIKEYRPWKGFLAGLAACVPLIIFMIIHTVLIIIDPTKVWAGELGGYIYMIVFLFIKPDISMALAPGQYYICLIALPIYMLFTGIPYILSYRRIQNQYDEIERKHKEIYGEDK